MRLLDKQSKHMLAAVLTLLVLVALGFINFVHFSQESILAQDVQNAGHLLIFCLMAVAVYGGLSMLAGEQLGRGRRLWIAAAILGVLGLISEGLQVGTPRDADVGDLLRDYVGAYLGIIGCLVFSWAKTIRSNTRGRMPAVLLLAVLLGVGMLAASAIPVMTSVAASLERNRSFPNLLPMSRAFVRRYVEADSVKFLEVPEDTASAQWLRFVFTDKLFPGLILADPVKDWRGYRRLRLRYRLSGVDSRAFVLMLDTCEAIDHDFMLRYDLQLWQGEHDVDIDFSSIYTPSRLSDAALCVDRLYLKTTTVDSEVILDIREIRLVP